MLSAEEELIDEINTALDADEDFDNLLDAAEALLDQFLEYDEEEENAVPDHTSESVLDHGLGAECFESLSELDKELQIWEKEENDEVSDESDNEEPAQSLIPLEIEFQIKEKMLQL